MAKVVIDNLYKSYTSSTSKFSASTNLGLGVVSSSSSVNITKTETPPPNTNVLKGINLNIEDGEFMVLVGPSGCGKSTLLRLIAGLEGITGGKIWIGDGLVNDLPPKMRDIAMVFQNYALYPHLRVYDNLAFGLRRMNPDNSLPQSQRLLGKLMTTATAKLPLKWRYQSTQEKNIHEKIHQVANLLQIEHLLQRFPKQLSGGQKQRVALGRAIARNPQVFLMDEPLSNLDAKLRTETRSQIVKLQKQLQVTTIYVTHDQTEAMTMGDRIAIMNNGEIQQVAKPLEVYKQPANKFVAEFIGTPPMNFLEVNWQKPNLITHPLFKVNLPSQWLSILENYNYEKIWLGVRPEHFQIASKSPETIAVTINLIEALGNETIFTVNLNDDSGQNMQVKTLSDFTQKIKLGDILYLSIDLTKISLFDYYQQQNILTKAISEEKYTSQ